MSPFALEAPVSDAPTATAPRIPLEKKLRRFITGTLASSTSLQSTLRRQKRGLVRVAGTTPSTTLKNPTSLSFRGVPRPRDEEESLKSFVSRAGFHPFAPLRVGMTTFTKLSRHPARPLDEAIG
jgi:hypothetical protein